jgi:tetraprenyl-beta-curcumene synthase
VTADGDVQDQPLWPPRRGLRERLALAVVFVRAALRYWLAILPRTTVELFRWRRRIALIPDAELRRAALEALAKRGNMEGAAAFAALASCRRRGAVVRASVAFQLAYNYADVLAEQSSCDPVGNARHLHESLFVAVSPGDPHADYYARCPRREDGGYLADVVDACRAALVELPGYAAVEAPARESAARIMAFQSVSLDTPAVLERWARSLPSKQGELEWWERAAAAGSSLGVHVLIAAAATAPSLTLDELAAIEDAYFPWVGALHSLLDSLVDECEDAATAQLSLVGCYPTTLAADAGMRRLAARALAAARGLPDGRRHEILLAAMACHYLSSPELSAPGTRRGVAEGVRKAIGGMSAPALLVFGVWRLARRGVGRVRAAAVRPRRPPARLGDRERGVDAGAA